MEKTTINLEKKEAEIDTTTEIEKYFIEKEHQNQITWDPKITGFIENLPDELIKIFDDLSHTGNFPIPKENETRAFYMRIVDNHIEIGIANIEFIR